METILVVEDTDSLREVLCSFLGGAGYTVTPARTAEEGLEKFRQEDFSLVLSDLKLPQKSGLDFLEESKRINSSTPIIMMTAYGNIDIAVKAMKLGAIDFICKPFDPVVLRDMVQKVARIRRLQSRMKNKFDRTILTQSPTMEEVLSQAKKVAPLGTPVLILGESGTGKELLARYIHQHSARAEHSFVAVNCGSMPGELLESEFFGHEPGAFTGASETRSGLFEEASGGSIFLDEIGNMPHHLQVKLLRTLQESEIKPLGSNVTKKVDLRVISATNSNLEKAVAAREFREDLYYRLGVFLLEIPPLRDRPDDIRLLAKHFVRRFSSTFFEERRTLSKAALKLLSSHHWPGNIRELENAIERAVILSDTPLLEPQHFELLSVWPKNSSTELKSLAEVSAEASKNAETKAIKKALKESKGNKSKAAKALGVSYKTMLNKCKTHCPD